MSDRKTADAESIVDAEGFKALLGKKGEGIEVSWIEALVAAGVTLTMQPFDPADIEAARSEDVKPLVLAPTR